MKPQTAPATPSALPPALHAGPVPAPDAPAASPAETQAQAWSGALPLPHWGLIAARGPQGAHFLHNQLSQDFALLGMEQARLAALCNAKGRMLASFIGWRAAAEEWLLVCARDLLPQTLAQLKRFVLRAKVELRDASAEYALWGAVGSSVPAALPAACWSKRDEGAQTWVRLPAALGAARALLCQPVAQPAPVPASEPALAPGRWAWLALRSAVPLLNAALVEQFVPQMLNYESVGGVNFKKGCYPGQEVVARSQFRGTLKRRTFLAHCASAAPTLGQEVFGSSDVEQACGSVLQVATHPDGGWDALLCLQVSCADGQTLHLGQADGPALRLLPLPYDLLADV